jgi:hypothetical protein
VGAGSIRAGRKRGAKPAIVIPARMHIIERAIIAQKAGLRMLRRA